MPGGKHKVLRQSDENSNIYVNLIWPNHRDTGSGVLKQRIVHIITWEMALCAVWKHAHPAKGNLENGYQAVLLGLPAIFHFICERSLKKAHLK